MNLAFRQAKPSLRIRAMRLPEVCASSIPRSRLRGPLRQRLQQRLLGPTLAQCGLFDMDYVRLLLEQHASGRC